MLKIINARDVAEMLGYPDAQTWLLRYSIKLRDAGAVRQIFSGEVDKDANLHAVASIDTSRWLGKCPFCERSNYIDPEWPFFYCFGCGNNNTGKAIPVDLPSDWREIEDALLCRPVINPNRTSKNILDEALQSKPLDGLRRTWSGQSMNELQEENMAMRKKDTNNG